MRFWVGVLGRLGVVLGASWDVLERLGRIFFGLGCVFERTFIVFLKDAGLMFEPFVVESALWGLPKGFREVPKMCFDGLARVSRAAAQLAVFLAKVLDVFSKEWLFRTCSSTCYLLTRFPFSC